MLAAVLSVGDVSILEGNDGAQQAEVVVSLSKRHGGGVTVNYSTGNGTASAGSDYNAVSDKLTFSRGQTSKTILVPVIGDRLAESDEQFFVKLSKAKGAKIADGKGVVTIVDNEPRISISDVRAAEGSSGTTPFAFTVSLSSASDLPVTVNYATTDGSARAGIDYTAASGPLVFAPGQTSKTITVGVNSDGNRLPGPDKTFLVNLSTSNSCAVISKGVGVGTIVDNEPRISIADAYNYYGETSFTFTVSLSAAYDQVVTVNFATANDTAIAGTDYVASAGTLSFARGETTKTITVDVLDTTAVDKWFSLHLSGVSTNALIVNELAYGYLYNNYYYDYGYYDYGYYDYGYYYYYDYYGGW